MVWDAGVSKLKVEIVCGLRLSKSWKSSFLRLSIGLPFGSRTTTRTRTTFTRTLKVVDESRVTTSAVEAGWEVLPEAFAGSVVGRVELSGAGGAWAHRGRATSKGSNAKNGKKKTRSLKGARTKERGVWRMIPS